MISQAQIKYIHALQVKKYRQKYRNYIVEGDKMVQELLRFQPQKLSALYAVERWQEQHGQLLRGVLDKFNLVQEHELARISALNTPNQVLAIVEMPEDAAPEPARAPCFYLDGIQDPGNLGSILRIADWFGFPAVYCSPECVDVFNPKVVQASMGAIFRVRCMEIGLQDLLQAVPEWRTIGADLEGESAFEAQFDSFTLLVIGNEGNGISAANQALLHKKVSIPRHPEGGAESLNAAIASGILAALVRKQTV